MSGKAAPSAPTTDNYDADGVQRFSEFNAQGQELPDPIPASLLVGPVPRTLQEQIADELRLAEWRAAAQREGFDTPEEADDLEIEDDPLDPLTKWEAEFEASQQRIASRKASLSSASPSSAETKVETPKSVESTGSASSGLPVSPPGSSQSSVLSNADKSK